MLTRLPVPASSIPQTLEYYDSTGQHELTNLLVGDVWICGGRSNREWTVRNSNDADAEIAAANHPLIRHITIEKRIAREPISTAAGTGVTCKPETVPYFIAVGYFFARDVHAKTNIPVGLINGNGGGTSAEAWRPPCAYDDLSLRAASTSHQAVASRGIANRVAADQEKVATWEAGPKRTRSPTRLGLPAPKTMHWCSTTP
jgi:sialate O-acetylesterase